MLYYAVVIFYRRSKPPATIAVYFAFFLWKLSDLSKLNFNSTISKEWSWQRHLLDHLCQLFRCHLKHPDCTTSTWREPTDCYGLLRTVAIRYGTLRYLFWSLFLRETRHGNAPRPPASCRSAARFLGAQPAHGASKMSTGTVGIGWL